MREQEFYMHRARFRLYDGCCGTSILIGGCTFRGRSGEVAGAPLRKTDVVR